MFPSGRVGAALFGLRLSAAFLLLQVQFLTHGVSASTSGVISIIAAAFLTVGFLTPCSFLVCLLASAWTVLANQQRSVSLLMMPGILSIIASLLGPGAFSVDALIYGRRFIPLVTHKKRP